MSLKALLIGRPIPNDAVEEEKVSAFSAVPLLGLDALGSAAYGPEAALTMLLAVGAGGLRYILPITLAIIGLLLVVQFSYRQTIAAYPEGGGSYTVARQNLGQRAGLLAAAALALDYMLNVAVAISAGVGALVSAVPALLPYMLPLCLALLVLITFVNLRGVRTAGLAFLAPTYLFVGTLGLTLLFGLYKAATHGGHPPPVVTPPVPRFPAAAASLWLVIRAFSSGCTALTGIEAVSNAVPIFRSPRRKRAQHALLAISLILLGLLLGIALLCRAYGISATPPGAPGFQSVLSQLVGAVAGRGSWYYVTLASIIAVLCLSANTSFADFPRLCRLLALDGHLPSAFAHAGPRLVYNTGITVLSALAGVLLIAFDGVTDHLVPLFAVGAFSAFTLSQFGMVAHWKKCPQTPHARRAQAINAFGGALTLTALVILAVAKFTEGAWLSLLFIPVTYALLRGTRAHYDRVSRATAKEDPLSVVRMAPPAVVVPMKRLDLVTQKALRFAYSISTDVHAVQVHAQPHECDDDLARSWDEKVAAPLLAQGLPPPKLVLLHSEYRELIDPLLRYVRTLGREEPQRFVAVLVPELIERRWYHYLLHSHTATLLKMQLLFRGGPRVVVINAPWYLREKRSLGVADLRRGQAHPHVPWAPHRTPVS